MWLLLLSRFNRLIVCAFLVGKSSSNLANSSHTSPKPEMKDDATETAINHARKPSEPYFIVPPGFRANTFFVGRDKEYRELDRSLFDKRRRIGTAAVLLHGQAGGGKSHLARQYVNRNRERFAGGIFWITSKLREERYQAYWTIFQKVISREAPELCTNEKSFVEVVKTWFEGRQEWLLVFDGVTLDQDEDATELQTFVPDSKNSSIIYISRAKSLESKQRLLRPAPIRVGPLREDDARKLLFKSLDEFKKKRPSDADVKRGTELVKKVGGLPLAIDAISHRIADTHEPLAKFNIKSYSADPKMAGTYNVILDDLQRLGYMKAWNLIHILCFFGQHIPVELVHLGLKSLHHDGIDVKSSDSGKPDLNLTFGILMRYALIERNEPDDSSCGSGSSSRDSLTGPEPIDVLKIHGVVQRFCCDSLNAKKMLPEWLGYAVRLFAYSYHQADVRIKQKPAPGRVSDYREYLTHGRRLRDHADLYESKTQSMDDIKVYLDPILTAISEEIEFREPDSSSQDSLTERIQQVSIFDRTSSTSSSAPSGSGFQIQTPNRPSPLPLPTADENQFGFPLHKPSIDSPRSIGTLTPVSGGPRIAGETLRTRFPPFQDDDGYDTDGEDANLRSSVSMQRERSDMTARPRADPVASKNSGGELVHSSTRLRKTLKRRDLGTFRPQRTPANAEVDRRHVSGSVSRPAEPVVSNERPNFSAVQALSEVQNRSPPISPSRRSSFWRLASPARIANAFGGQPSEAGTTTTKSRATQTPPATAPWVPIDLSSRPTSAGSTAATDGRDHVYNLGPSPLAIGSVSQQHSNRQHQQEYALDGRYESLRYPIGPNPAPFPMIENITTSQKRPHQSDTLPDTQYQFYSSSVPQITSSTHYLHTSHATISPTLPHTVPAGYSSQPMSRDVSDRSHFSNAVTEPPYPHPASVPSPQLGTVTPYHLNETQALSPSRDRCADGRPVRKSPKTMIAYPAPTTNTDAEYSLQGAGAWTPMQMPNTPARYPLPSPSENSGRSHVRSLSRSSSGPGVAIETPSQGLGIVPFAPPAGPFPLSSSPGSPPPLPPPPDYPSYSMQFGEHAPISLEEARRGAITHETRLRQREREIQELRQMAEDVEFQRKRMQQVRNMEREHSAGATPYPAVDMMPTEGDGRPRSGSEPWRVS